MSVPFLSVSGLTKRYGSEPVVKDLTFDVACGEILAIVGANGAGKTTTFRIVSGLAAPTSGTIVLNGTDITSLQARRPELGALIEGPGLFRHLSAGQNLRIISWLAGHQISDEKVRQLLTRVGLEASAKRRVSAFSTGMAQRLAIAVTMLASPKLLILDEPTSGLDAIGILEVRKLIRDLGRDGHAVLWASHDLREVEDISDRLLVLHRGTTRFAGRPSELPRGREVLEFTVSEPGTAFRVLQAAGNFPETEQTDTGIRVSGRDAASVIAVLSAEGVSVSDFKKIRTNFEDIFATFAENTDA